MIEAGSYATVSPTTLPGWNSMLGVQFENVVLKNRELIHETLGINPVDIVASGAYFQRQRTRQQGCQIDYLIQTKYKTLLVCEIKFSQNPISMSVISSVKDKITKLIVPRGFAVVPVLIHVGEVTETVSDAGYFVNIIDLSKYLEK